MVTDLLQIGNKIDICSLDKDDIRRAENGKVPILASQLEAVEDNGELIIQMPVYKGKIILLSLGSRYELIFYTRKGLYRGVCQVTDRYKEDNLFMVKVMLKSGLNKFQRREYFRLECILGMQAYELTREDALRLDGASLEQHLKDPQAIMTESSSVIVDISGGGIRFVSDERIEPESFILIIIRLTNDKIDQTFYLVTEMIDSIPSPKVSGKFISRGKFLFKDLKDREGIVRYVFEEERRIRRKEMGS